ncbi:hypothetical protein KAX21_06675, partial [candidate division WOR-3 bacterium]|nr:hypothetical protein [candidate division WOR-3 bacterium]
ETVRARFGEFRRLTEPVIGYYRSRGELATVSTSGPVEEVQKKVAAAIDGRCGRQASGGAVG